MTARGTFRRADIAKTIGLVTDNAGVFINPFIRFYEPDAVKSRLSAVGFVDEIDLAVGQICIGIHEKSGLLLLKKCHGYVLAVSAIDVPEPASRAFIAKLVRPIFVLPSLLFKLRISVERSA